MIRASQNGYFKHLVGADATSGLTLPDHVKVAAAYGLASLRIDGPEDMPSKLQWALESPGPVVCEVMVKADEPRERRAFLPCRSRTAPWNLCLLEEHVAVLAPGRTGREYDRISAMTGTNRQTQPEPVICTPSAFTDAQTGDRIAALLAGRANYQQEVRRLVQNHSKWCSMVAGPFSTAS